MSIYIEFLVTFGFLIALIWGMMRFMLKDLHKDLLDIRTDIGDLKTAQHRIDARIDHLYEENNRQYTVLMEIVKK